MNERQIEIDRERGCVRESVCVRKRDRDRVRVCVREKEREGERERVRESPGVLGRYSYNNDKKTEKLKNTRAF